MFILLLWVDFYTNAITEYYENEFYTATSKSTKNWNGWILYW